MLISGAAARTLDEIAARERDVLHAYTPGAAGQYGDAAKPPAAQPTIDPLSVAAPADAYFIASGDRGRMLFTRDGSFAVRDGTLVDAQGRAVLGYARDGAVLGALKIDGVDDALGFSASLRVESDGGVTYDRAAIDPRTGRREVQRARVGYVALARFAPGTKLQAVDAQHSAAPPGILPHIGKSGDGSFGALTPNSREGSGIDIDAGLQRLQEAYLALDAIRAADMAQRGVEKTAMDLLK